MMFIGGNQTLDDLRENIAMSCTAITLDTLQNVVHAAVWRLQQCLDADGGHFEHLHWIQNSRTYLISILLLYKYSSYDYTVIFFMSKCVYIFLGHPFIYYILLTVHHIMILGEWPTWCTNFLLRVYFYLQLSTCFEHTVLIIRRDKLFQYSLW